MVQLGTTARKYLRRRASYFAPHGKDFFFILVHIEMKLWKVVQSQVELMKINFKFEAPNIQVQIVTSSI